MVRRRAALMVAVVTLVWRMTSGRIPTTEHSPFCRKEPTGFICSYFNTTQDVVVGGGPVAASVASQHPAISCLDVTNDSSTNTQLGKPATSHRPQATQPSPNRTMANVTGTQTPSRSSRVGAKQGNGTTALHYQPQQHYCAVNVSVQDSTVHRVRGHFVAAKFHKSNITDLDGVYMHLKVTSSEVFNMSVRGRMIQMEDTKIEFVSQLTAQRCLQLRRVELGTVARDGLKLFRAGGDWPARRHTLRDVTVRRLEAGSLLVFGAKVNVTNTTVEWAARDGVMVQTPGMLTLTNVVLHCAWYDCLNLETGARLLLRNVTVRNKTINTLDLLVNSETDTYPLFVLVSKEDRRPLDMSFPWYWLVVMTACGIVAGVVIGSALMWKRPSLRTISTFTLSDLLSHDRLQQENNEDASRSDHAMGHLPRPAIRRQDSGLTSSSFATYMPFQTSTLTTDVEHGTSGPTSYRNSFTE